MGKINIFLLFADLTHFCELPWLRYRHACSANVTRHFFKTLAQSCCTLLLSCATDISLNCSDGSAYGAHGRIAVPSGVTGKRCGWPLHTPRLSIQVHAFRIRCAEELDEWVWQVHHSEAQPCQTWEWSWEGQCGFVIPCSFFESQYEGRYLYQSDAWEFIAWCLVWCRIRLLI